MSARDLKLAIAEAQNDDPSQITLPNACPGCIVQLQDNTACRAFSVSVHTPNTLPEDEWVMIKMPGEMPKATNAQLEVNTEFILVDKITCGLMDGNRLTTTFNEEGKLTAIVMQPPEEEDDAAQHWANKAQEFTDARKPRHV